MPEENKKPAQPRPYIVQRRIDIEGDTATVFGRIGVTGDAWYDVGIYEATRADLAMKAAAEAEFDVPPAETTVALYRAFPKGNESRKSLTYEVKPVLTWE